MRHPADPSYSHAFNTLRLFFHPPDGVAEKTWEKSGKAPGYKFFTVAQLPFGRYDAKSLKARKESAVGKSITQKMIEAHLVSGDRARERDRHPDRPDPHPGRHGHDGLPAVRGHGHPAGARPSCPSATWTTTRSRPASRTPTTTGTCRPWRRKYGICLSRAGNGICHQVHLERFGAPGKTLLGSDSHTPTGGGIGMIAIGAGGLDVAWPWAASRST